MFERRTGLFDRTFFLLLEIRRQLVNGGIANSSRDGSHVAMSDVSQHDTH